MNEVTKAEDVVPVTTPVFKSQDELRGQLAPMWKPIPMNWPQGWQVQQGPPLTPCYRQFLEELPHLKPYQRLYIQPPGWGWVMIDIELPAENEIIVRVDNSIVFSNLQYGGILQSLVTTYAHKFAMRVWHGIESK